MPIWAYVGSTPTAAVPVPHEKQTRDKHCLPAHPVAEVAEDDATERSYHESDTECGERCQGAGERVERREENFIEDQRRCGAEDEHVEELDQRADEASECDLRHGDRSCRSGRHGSTFLM